MLTLKLQVNHNMVQRYPNKNPDEKYRVILTRAPFSSLYFYFTRDELYNFADELVNLVSRLPNIENDPSLTGLESVINDTQPAPATHDNNVTATSQYNPTAKSTKITAAQRTQKQ